MAHMQLSNLFEGSLVSESDSAIGFGIKKVIGHRTDANGMMRFKVEWESTWETADALAGCQHLVNNYWASQMSSEADPKALKKKLSLNSTLSDVLQDFRLSTEFKLSIQQLLDGTRLSNYQEGNLSSSILPQGQTPWIDKEITDAFPKTPSKKRRENIDQSSSPTAMTASSVQYLENFSNPYVKIVVVCKICSKEQPPKTPGDWKRHFLTHCSDEEKPFKCSFCGKGFIRNDKMLKHAKAHEKACMKSES